MGPENKMIYTILEPFIKKVVVRKEEIYNPWGFFVGIICLMLRCTLHIYFSFGRGFEAKPDIKCVGLNALIFESLGRSKVECQRSKVNS